MAIGAEHLDPRAIRRAFDHAAPGYEAHAAVQHEIGLRLRDRVLDLKIDPRVVLDLGCGPGSHLHFLEKRFRRARVLGIDIAPGMLQVARRQARRWFGRQRFVCADMQRLPLADGCADLVFSSAALQWCNDLDAAVAEMRRVLRPGGALLIASFGPGTLAELRAAWAAVDGAVHVHRFHDLQDLGDALARAGFAGTVTDIDRITELHRDLRGLMRSLKGIGAHNVADGRPHGLTGRARLAAVEAAYETRRTAEGLLPATWEVVYAHGWADVAASAGACATDAGNTRFVLPPLRPRA